MRVATRAMTDEAILGLRGEAPPAAAVDMNRG